MSLTYLIRPKTALLSAALVLGGCSSSAVDESSNTDAQTSDDTNDGSTTGDASSSSTTANSGGGSGTTTGPESTTGDASSTGGDDTDTDDGSAGDALPGYGDDGDGCDPESISAIGLELPDSNAMVSPVQARMAVLDGWGIFGDLFIRPWEFLAYYPFDYAPAPPGELALRAELYVAKDQPEGSYELQVGVTGPWLSDEARPPLDLTLVLDVSGSMKGVPVTILKEACKALLTRLRAGDGVSIVTWDSDDPVLLAHHQVSGPSDPDLKALIDGLEATGGSDLFAGLSAGYELAAETKDPERVSRVILMSDGGAAADAKALELIDSHASDKGAQEGIYLVGVGVGTYGGYQPALMDSVAAVGRGSTLFIGSADEANKTLADRFLSVMLVAARDVEVEVVLPPGFSRRLPEELIYGDAPTSDLRQPMRQNEALVYYERLASCAPEQIDDSSPLEVRVTYRDAATFEPGEVVLQTTFGELLSKGVKQLHKGAAVVRYSEALRLWNEAPSDPEAYLSAAQAALGRVALAQAKIPDDPGLAEIESVLNALLKGMQ
ncbi:MAG: VWA domain-containing protein [Myxococcales bacterium]|nr:VWA domain-containing protein [Myxococcales bacterium]